MPEKDARNGVAIVATFPPRKGGVSVQAALLSSYLETSGIRVVWIDTDIPGLRKPVLRWLMVVMQPLNVLRKLIVQRGDYRVVHFLAASYWGFMPSVVGVPLCRMMRKRSVVSYVGGLGPLFVDRFPWLTKPIFRRASATTVCSVELRDEFERRGISGELVNNTFESELFTPGTRGSVKRKLVWTRSFEHTYDPMTAVRAFEIVKTKYPDASLVMTSDGSLALEVRDYIREHNIRDISLPGRVPKEEVARLMQEADICINTSRHDGTPTALLEAAGTALPIVTTPVGGIPTVFEDGVSAVMVPVGDAEAMAKAVIDLMENPSRADELGRAAREVALSHTWERLEKTWLRIYGFSSGGD